MIIHVVVMRPDPSEDWECDVAFRTAKEANAYIRREMKGSPVPREEWEEFFYVQEVELK